MMLGRRRLGLGIGRDRVSAVLMVGGTVRWSAHRPRQPDASLIDTIASLLAECPRHRMLPLSATAALGPTMSQLKCLTELPPVRDSKAIVALVRENTGRFFLRNGIPLLISGAHVESPSRVWVAAVDAPVVADVAAGCRRAGISLRAVVPSAVALRHATLDSSVAWLDGDVRLDITLGEKTPVSVRRSPANGADPEMPAVAGTRAGDTAANTLDAAGAALTRRSEPILIRIGDTTRTAASRQRLTRAAVACGIGCAVALVFPSVIASVSVRRDRAREASIETSARTARAESNELAQATAALRALTDFSNSRRSMVLLLAEITRSLSDSSALVAFQVDSSGSGSVVALSSHAAAVVDAVERTPGLASPQIIGPVTRESVGGRTIERVAVRFQILSSAAP